jgi:hypothetical protein
MPDIERESLKSVDRYIAIIKNKGVSTPINETLVEKGDPTSLKHLLWMCIELKKKIVPDKGTGFSTDKFSRWIGYIQGVLVSKGLTTVDIERNVTKSWFTGD